MNQSLFSLALQGMLRKRKSSLLVLLVLMLSFSFAIVSLSLLGSITKTNQEFRKDTYGNWYFAVQNGLSQDEEQWESWNWVEEYGTMKSYGSVYTQSTLCGFGTLDEDMISVGRLTLDQGSWPATENQLVLEADVLSALGYDYTLGQEITLTVSVPCGDTWVDVDQTFTLSGVLREYSDLWLQGVDGASAPVSAITTEETAAQILETAQAQATQLGLSIDSPTVQYYLQTEESVLTDETRRSATAGALSDYLASSREEAAGEGDSAATSITNQALLSDASEQLQNNLCLWLIALVALAAVLCVYLLNLSQELQRCATLRSLGMTRPQLLILSLEEAVILLVPAVIVGIPVGIFLTWIGLRLTAFSGSAEIVVQVPYARLVLVILLWLAVALLARLVLFLLAIRVPLTGRFQSSRKNARWISAARSGVTVIPLLVLGTAVFLDGFGLVIENADREDYANQAHYTIHGSTTEAGQREAVPETVADDLSKLAGVQTVTSYSFADVSLSFNGNFAGIRNRQVQLVVLDEDQLDQWDEALNFGGDRELFEEGLLVFLCFPDSSVDSGHMYLDYAYLEDGEELSLGDYVLPNGVVSIDLYNEDHQVLTTASARASVRYLSYAADRSSHSVELHSSYTVVCSGAFVKSALSQVGDSVVWTPPYQETDFDQGTWIITRYPSGSGFGYQAMDLRADAYGNTTLTDNLIATYCKEQGLSLTNNRQTYMALEQEQLQSLILTVTGSVCIGLMALLVLMGLFSLEAEQEKRRYALLRAIGLSKGQLWGRILGKTLLRGLLTALGGGLIYLSYQLKSAIESAAHPVWEGSQPYQMSLAQAWGQFRSNLIYYGISERLVLLLAAICLVSVTLVTLAAKSRLGKETASL